MSVPDLREGSLMGRKGTSCGHSSHPGVRFFRSAFRPDGSAVNGYYDSLRLRIFAVQIIAQCPRCSSTWLLDGSAADRRIRCEKCHRLFKVPGWEEVPKAIRIIRSAKGTIYVDQDGKTYG